MMKISVIPYLHLRLIREFIDIVLQRHRGNDDVAGGVTETPPAISYSMPLIAFGLPKDAGSDALNDDKGPEEEIVLDRCRQCSENFDYSHEGWNTTIIAGIPKEPGYKAVSYVWGKVKSLPLRCLQC